jgi:serine/threonine protein kinase
MHNEGVAHRDIKMHNIMINKDGDFIVIDFGLSSTSCSRNRQTFPVCTVTTRPPEYLKMCDNDQSQQQITFDSFKTDIWSLGCVLSALSDREGKYIIQGHSEDEIRVSMNNLFSKSPENRITPFQDNLLGKDGQELLWSMLRKDPSQRPSIEQVLQHKFFLD